LTQVRFNSIKIIIWNIIEYLIIFISFWNKDFIPQQLLFINRFRKKCESSNLNYLKIIFVIIRCETLTTKANNSDIFLIFLNRLYLIEITITSIQSKTIYYITNICRKSFISINLNWACKAEAFVVDPNNRVIRLPTVFNFHSFNLYFWINVLKMQNFFRGLIATSCG